MRAVYAKRNRHPSVRASPTFFQISSDGHAGIHWVEHLPEQVGDTWRPADVTEIVQQVVMMLSIGRVIPATVTCAPQDSGVSFLEVQ